MFGGTANVLLLEITAVPKESLPAELTVFKHIFSITISLAAIR